MAVHAHPSPLRSHVPVLPATLARAGGRILIATTFAAGTGVLTGIVMPRGPVTPAHALALLAIALTGGFIAGLVLGSRWAMLLAPLAHLAAFEVTRLAEAGPTVDGIHLTSTFGVIAFIFGRGVYLLLGLLPMALAAGRGATPFPRSLPRQVARHAASLALVALSVWIALPASVPAVVDANGDEISGSIAELVPVTLGGNEQWIEIRAANPDAPVMLYIAGGPGQSDLALARAMLQPIEQDVVLVLWDQRGNGLSYRDFDPEDITLENAIADTIELTEFLNARFDEQKVYLMGESWGTTLAVLAAQQRPDLFHAVIGSGQMVSQRETDIRIYHDLLAWADANDTGLAEYLRDVGEPPYPDVMAYGVVMTNYAHIEPAYDPPQAAVDRLDAAGVGFWGMMGNEYTPIDKANVFRGLIDTFDVLYPQLQGIDFREQVPTLDVPLYIFDGEAELAGRRDLAQEWFVMVDAPQKEMFTFADGGHAVALEHADDLHRILNDTIFPATYPGE